MKKLIKKILDYVQKIQTFRATVREWFGEGAAPVSSRQAQARANQCAACPFNHGSGSTGLEIVPSIIMRRIEAKNKMRLMVDNEWQITTCLICSCYLPLKVHVPIVHIRRYMPQVIVDKIRENKPDCWQISETV